MKAIEIIDETVEFYSKNPRSKNPDNNYCMYNRPNGAKCAFSRCCTDDSKFWEGTGIKYQTKATLKPQYANIPKDHLFWTSLQILHDSDHYWQSTAMGLTANGLAYVREIKERYANLE